MIINNDTENKIYKRKEMSETMEMIGIGPRMFPVTHDKAKQTASRT